MAVLCALDEIPEEGARAFSTFLGDIFLVRRGGRVWGYRNSCPHTGVALNWQPHDFINPEYRMIQCAMHAALFRLEDGYCEWGPCRGRSLTAIPVRVRDGRVELEARCQT
ncbi:Rieske (2Fe-2S) protein [Ectothiorhodospiraceae bacterium 2226]|nr:Rieske (2Fe-2S) protein [Ectothiorhodospiraceae bacterium 2226]